MKIKDRKIVIVNQATNYLTIGFTNAFYKKFESVTLITGSVHVQGEELHQDIKICKINNWKESPGWKKMLSYLLACVRIYFLLITKFRKHEVFFVSLPPMGYLLTLLLPQKCSMVIWDIYPDAFKIVGWSEQHPVYRLWSNLNVKCFKKAYRVITISDVMAKALHQYVSSEKLKVQPIWSIFQGESPVKKEDNLFIKEHKLSDKFIVQYSGNIGLTHKVELMVKLAELMVDEKDVLFQIIGRGPRKAFLRKMVEQKNLPNCMFLPFQSDEMFPYSLSAADVGMVILDEQTSKGSVPSKSYNLMSYGIPSLYIAGADSQLALYANKFQHGICLNEGELEKAKKFILQLKEDNERYSIFCKNSLQAASQFKRSNADKFVNIYLDDQ